jgi:hypothetical protein
MKILEPTPEPRLRQNPMTGVLYTNRPLTEDELHALDRLLFGDDSPQAGITPGTILEPEEGRAR